MNPETSVEALHCYCSFQRKKEEEDDQSRGSRSKRRHKMMKRKYEGKAPICAFGAQTCENAHFCNK
jgi:hypothetical protein